MKFRNLKFKRFPNGYIIGATYKGAAQCGNQLFKILPPEFQLEPKRYLNCLVVKKHDDDYGWWTEGEHQNISYNHLSREIVKIS